MREAPPERARNGSSRSASRSEAYPRSSSLGAQAIGVAGDIQVFGLGLELAGPHVQRQAVVLTGGGVRQEAEARAPVAYRAETRGRQTASKRTMSSSAPTRSTTRPFSSSRSTWPSTSEIVRYACVTATLPHSSVAISCAVRGSCAISL